MNKSGNVPGRMLTDYLYNKACKMKTPLSGTFELSPECNFNCNMCYVRKSKSELASNPIQPLTLDEWRNVALQAREEGMLYLLLTGGEPLMWPDFWKFYDELIDLGFIISINTNGSLIDQKAIEHLTNKPPQRVNITLYGASDTSYKKLCGVDNVFSKVDIAIRKLQEEGITVKLNSSLTPDNVTDLDKIIDYAEERNAVLSVTTYMFPPVRRDPTQIGVNRRFTPEESAKYILHTVKRQQGEKRYLYHLNRMLQGYVEPLGLDEGCIDLIDGRVRCRAGSASFWVTWDGWMTPCGMMPEPKVDIRKKGFIECWRQLTIETGNLKLSGTCNNCSNRNVCHACAAMAYAETGSHSGIPKYLCNTTQYMQKIAKDLIILDKKY